MEQNILKELSSATKSTNGFTDLSLLEQGETVWLLGKPAPAGKDTVALNIGGNASIAFRAKDVLETVKDGNDYLVKVKVGTALLYRVEVVTSAKRDTCQCGQEADNETDKNGSGSIASTKPTKRPKTCTIVCTETCAEFEGKDGQTYEICLPTPLLKCS